MLSPQVTGFVIDFVQKQFPGYRPRPISPNYAAPVEAFIHRVEGAGYGVAKIVALCGITILILETMLNIEVIAERVGESNASRGS